MRFIFRELFHLVGRKSQLPAEKSEQNKTEIGTKFQHVLFSKEFCALFSYPVNLSSFFLEEKKTTHSRNL